MSVCYENRFSCLLETYESHECLLTLDAVQFRVLIRFSIGFIITPLSAGSSAAVIKDVATPILKRNIPRIDMFFQWHRVRSKHYGTFNISWVPIRLRI